MIHWLIELSLRNRGLVLVIYLGLAGLGYWALLRTPIDAIPDLSDNQVIVFTDWTGRSPQCSFNGLMHQRWPNGVPRDVDHSAVTQESQAKIKANLPSYLWFSAVDTIELHLPYLGGGWSRAYNIYASLTMLMLYIGFVFGLTSVLRREYVLWFLLLGYNTAVFILTDATPRYLMPVIFCYALFAGIGYDWLIKKITRTS